MPISLRRRLVALERILGRTQDSRGCLILVLCVLEPLLEELECRRLTLHVFLHGLRSSFVRFALLNCTVMRARFAASEEIHVYQLVEGVSGDPLAVSALSDVVLDNVVGALLALVALNALILITTFVLVLASTDAQGEMAMMAGRSAPGRIVQSRSSATDFLRLVGSLEGLLPATALDSLTPEQLQAVKDALDLYRRFVDVGVSGILYSPPGGSPVRQRLQDLNKAARDEVEQTLRMEIRDDVIVGQLTTAVLRFG